MDAEDKKIVNDMASNWAGERKPNQEGYLLPMSPKTGDHLDDFQISRGPRDWLASQGLWRHGRAAVRAARYAHRQLRLECKYGYEEHGAIVRLTTRCRS